MIKLRRPTKKISITTIRPASVKELLLYEQNKLVKQNKNKSKRR